MSAGAGQGRQYSYADRNRTHGLGSLRRRTANQRKPPGAVRPAVNPGLYTVDVPLIFRVTVKAVSANDARRRAAALTEPRHGAPMGPHGRIRTGAHGGGEVSWPNLRIHDVQPLPVTEEAPC